MNPATDMPQRLLACLSDASRYRIVRLLGDGERCVTEIAHAVGLSQSCTTRHLQALARGRIVQRRRDGKRVLFRLDDRDPAVRDLLAWVGAGAARAGAAPAGAGPDERAPQSATAEERRPAGSDGGERRRAGAERPGRLPDRRRQGRRHEDEKPLPEESVRAAGGNPEVVGGMGGEDFGKEGLAEATPPVPNRPRPGDLEDYLL